MDRVVQGHTDVTMDATPERIWALLEDGDRLTEWAFMVKSTTGGREKLGAVRHCDVEFAGKHGTISERCIEHEPHTRIAWEMVEDSLGFAKMFADMGFGFTLVPDARGRTLVRNESFYCPRTLVARVLNAVMMRRRFASTRERILANLKRLVEEEAPSIDAGRTAS